MNLLLSKKELKIIVDNVFETIRMKKVFTICGNYPNVRKMLNERGWLEKSFSYVLAFPNPQFIKVPDLDDMYNELPEYRGDVSVDKYQENCRKQIITRVLLTVQPNFYWNLPRKEGVRLEDLDDDVYVNRFSQIEFACQAGFCSMETEMPWIAADDVAFAIYPRSYNPTDTNQFLGLIDDHRLTACVSFLKYLSQTKIKLSEDKPESVIQVEMIRFALDRCKSQLNFHANDDLDEDSEIITKKQWDLFLMHYHRIVRKKTKIVDHLHLMQVPEINSTLSEIYKVMPERKYDGIENTWIVKPWNALGNEVHMIQSLKELSSAILPSCYNKYRYTIQKYIEKQMLIFNTRFAIKRFFLIRSFEPLEVWMFKNYYVQFSSQITKSTAKLRDIRIPEHNLWDQRTFQLYLNGYGLLEKWKETACPKMCQSAIAAFLCSQKFVKQRKNSFQLIRTDFVLTPDMTPWLTNVNPMPNMTVGGPAIIKNFTSECLDDLIRVVFDRAENPAAFTGNFELVYKQNYVAMVNSAVCLEVEGQHLLSAKVDHRPKTGSLLDVEEANNKLRKQYGLRLIKPAIGLHESVAMSTLPLHLPEVSKSMQRLCEPLKLKDIRYHLESSPFKIQQRKIRKFKIRSNNRKTIKTIFKQSSKKMIALNMLENSSNVGEHTAVARSEVKSKRKSRNLGKKKKSENLIELNGSVKQQSDKLKKYLAILKMAREAIADCHVSRDLLTSS